jgi:hypothetical protein
MPNDNIERAIKRGTGESKDGEQLDEITYEGYRPGGVAVRDSRTHRETLVPRDGIIASRWLPQARNGIRPKAS